MTEQNYIERCEARAKKSKHRAWINDDGSIRVHSNSQPNLWHVVTYEVAGQDVIRFRCTCEAGQNRIELIPCVHAAKAAFRLEREGIAVKRGGLWRIPERLFADA